MQSHTTVPGAAHFESFLLALGLLPDPRPAVPPLQGSSLCVDEEKVLNLVRWGLGIETPTSDLARSIHYLAWKVAGEDWLQSPADREGLVLRVADALRNYLVCELTRKGWARGEGLIIPFFRFGP
jgi:hypothetical protein